MEVEYVSFSKWERRDFSTSSGEGKRFDYYITDMLGNQTLVIVGRCFPEESIAYRVNEDFALKFRDIFEIPTNSELENVYPPEAWLSQLINTEPQPVPKEMDAVRYGSSVNVTVMEIHMLWVAVTQRSFLNVLGSTHFLMVPTKIWPTIPPNDISLLKMKTSCGDQMFLMLRTHIDLRSLRQEAVSPLEDGDKFLVYSSKKGHLFGVAFGKDGFRKEILREEEYERRVANRGEKRRKQMMIECMKMKRAMEHQKKTITTMSSIRPEMMDMCIHQLAFYVDYKDEYSESVGLPSKIKDIIYAQNVGEVKLVSGQVSWNCSFSNGKIEWKKFVKDHALKESTVVFFHQQDATFLVAMYARNGNFELVYPWHWKFDYEM